MRALIQRSNKSGVSVDNKVVGSIDSGLVVFVGFTNNDTIEDINYIIKKILNLRIFDDEFGIMNLSVLDTKKSILVVSQFTLYANPYNGNRPSYVDALKSEESIKLYDEFVKLLKEQIHVETGIFGAEMKVNILNDGPITIWLDSKK